MKKVLLCTGGTGGHIFPMLSLYDKLKDDYEVKILTDIRAKKYLDTKDIIIINSESPFRKSGFLHKIKTLFTLLFATMHACLIFLIHRPHIIVGSGGYVSFPILFIATIFNKKFYLYETNSVLGRVNKFFLSRCHRMLSGYKEVINFPEKYNYKFRYVGQLVRNQFLDTRDSGVFLKNIVKSKYKDVLKILVIGGSQGAKVFGEKLPICFRSLIEKDIYLSIDQQIQKEQLEYLSNFYGNITKKFNNKYEDKFIISLFTFHNNLEEYIKKADIVISRSGSSTLSELASLNKPFVAIPLPSSLDNHQFYNAKYYLDKNCCWMLNENDIDFDIKLTKTLTDIYKNKYLLNTKKNNLINLKMGNPIDNFKRELQR